MSTEQSDALKEVANSPGETSNSVAITQQATTPTPTTAPQRAKNPKRVAAGKLTAEKTRLAREQQKKAAAEAEIIIANNKTKAAAPDSNPVAAPPSESETPKSTVENNSSLSTTQWIAVASLIASLIGIYYKREELQAIFSKSGGTPPPKDSNKVDESQPVRLTVFRKNSPEPQPARAKQPRGVKHLD